MNRIAPLRSIAVFGGGVVALSAAAAFARALPWAGVTLVVTPLDAAAFADNLPTLWPSSAAVLARIGLDEAALVTAGATNHRLAQRFTGWSRDGSPWLAAEGEPIGVAGRGALHHRWLAASAAGLALPFHALFPAAALAEAERLGLPMPAVLERADHALRLDPAWLTRALAQQLAQAKGRAGSGTIRAVERRADGGIAAVALADGRRIEADLFVDASGPAALLADPAAARIDWSATLPADRLLVTADAGASASLLDAYETVDHGWSAHWSMPRGGVRALAFADGVTSEARARRALGTGRDTAALVASVPGRAEIAWTGNRLALGEAAVQVGPLGLAGFSLALAQLDLALDLLPGRDMEPLLLAEYNRRAALRADRVRDYLAAHYLLGGRTRGPFWQALRDRELPDGLAATVAQFAQLAHLPHHEEESVNHDGWRMVLIGQGLRPRRPDPVAMGEDPAAAAVALRTAHGRLTTVVRELPLYRDWLAGARR